MRILSRLLSSLAILAGFAPGITGPMRTGATAARTAKVQPWARWLPLDGSEYIFARHGIKRRVPKRDKTISGRQWRKFRRKVGRHNAQMYLKALAARRTVHK